MHNSLCILPHTLCTTVIPKSMYYNFCFACFAMTKWTIFSTWVIHLGSPRVYHHSLVPHSPHEGRIFFTPCFAPNIGYLNLKVVGNILDYLISTTLILGLDVLNIFFPSARSHATQHLHLPTKRFFKRRLILKIISPPPTPIHSQSTIRRTT